MSTGLRLRKLSLTSVLSPIGDVTLPASASMSLSCEGSTGLRGNHQRLWDNATPVVSQGRQPAFLLSLSVRCRGHFEGGKQKIDLESIWSFFRGGLS